MLLRKREIEVQDERLNGKKGEREREKRREMSRSRTTFRDIFSKTEVK